ncbi:MAG: hypothetical protein IJE89_03870 [Bacilli bacterium]|nr:hypothetical protein [Bacilli bacterium]
MKRSSRVRFYRSVRAALLATNKRTDNSIITECNIVMPLVNSKGVAFEINKARNNRLKRVKKVNPSSTIFNKKS